jgi:hypothetical protein
MAVLVTCHIAFAILHAGAWTVKGASPKAQTADSQGVQDTAQGVCERGGVLYPAGGCWCVCGVGGGGQLPLGSHSSISSADCADVASAVNAPAQGVALASCVRGVALPSITSEGCILLGNPLPPGGVHAKPKLSLS